MNESEVLPITYVYTLIKYVYYLNNYRDEM